MPDISVVIPLYNKASYIARAISSVLSQCFQNFEIIVVDDGSTDNGYQIARNFEDQRISVISQKNSGVSAARNLGIQHANSDIVSFLDADDEYKDHFLDTILYLKNLFPEAGAYATAYDIMLPSTKLYKPKFNDIPPDWQGIIPSYFKASIGLHILSASSIAIPKSTFRSVGCFPIGERLGEDLDMWLRIALNFPIAYSNVSSQAIYHQGAANRTNELSVNIQSLPYINNGEKAINSGGLSLKMRDELIEYLSFRKIGYAKKSILTGNGKYGRDILKTIQSNKFQRKRLLWYFLSYVPIILFKFLRKAKSLFLFQ